MSRDGEMLYRLTAEGMLPAGLLKPDGTFLPIGDVELMKPEQSGAYIFEHDDLRGSNGGNTDG